MPISLNNYSPKTLSEAIELIVKHMNNDDKEFWKDEEAPSKVHFGFGMAMRNAWGLWKKETDLYKYFVDTYGLGHADDMSGMILEGVMRSVRGEPYDPLVKAESYKKFWKDMGVDPITGERNGKPADNN